MAVIRLFAAARLAAGTGSDQLPGATVDEVLSAAVERYGRGFAEVLQGCQVWLNGEPRAATRLLSTRTRLPSSLRYPAEAMVDDSSGATAAGPPLHPEWRADQTADLTARMPTVQARPAPREQIEGQPTVQLPVIKAPSVSAARIETDRPVILPSERRPPRRGFRARYAVVYDVNGPRVRLGIGWAILVAATLVYRPARPGALAVLYGGRPDGRRSRR